jgi:hypothetical protein
MAVVALGFAPSRAGPKSTPLRLLDGLGIRVDLVVVEAKMVADGGSGCRGRGVRDRRVERRVRGAVGATSSGGGEGDEGGGEA